MLRACSRCRSTKATSTTLSESRAYADGLVRGGNVKDIDSHSDRALIDKLIFPVKYLPGLCARSETGRCCGKDLRSPNSDCGDSWATASEAAMMGRQIGDQTSLFWEFRLDDRIPELAPIMGLRLQTERQRSKTSWPDVHPEIHDVSCTFLSSGVRVKSRWTTSPDTYGTRHSPQIPARHPTIILTPLRSRASAILSPLTTSKVILDFCSLTVNWDSNMPSGGVNRS